MLLKFMQIYFPSLLMPKENILYGVLHFIGMPFLAGPFGYYI